MEDSAGSTDGPVQRDGETEGCVKIDGPAPDQMIKMGKMKVRDNIRGGRWLQGNTWPGGRE